MPTVPHCSLGLIFSARTGPHRVLPIIIFLFPLLNSTRASTGFLQYFPSCTYKSHENTPTYIPDKFPKNGKDMCENWSPLVIRMFIFAAFHLLDIYSEEICISACSSSIRGVYKWVTDHGDQFSHYQQTRLRF